MLMPRLIVLVLVLALMQVLSTAHAQPPAQTPSGPVTHFGLTFPPEIGGAPRINVRAYEPDNRGGGYSAGYRHGEATSTVYIYDDRVASIPDNLDSTVARDQFNREKAVIGTVAAGHFGHGKECFHDPRHPKAAAPALLGARHGQSRRIRHVLVPRRLQRKVLQDPDINATACGRGS